MNQTFLSAVVLLLLVLDPLGSLPVFVSVMQTVSPARRGMVALRESLIALAILIGFMLGGDAFLSMMHLSERSLEVAGGVILLLIAMRMVFTHNPGYLAEALPGQEPIVFPIAVPMLAGPSALATVLVMASRQPERLAVWIAALAVAMTMAGVVLYAADRIQRWIGPSLVTALEKLMGLILCALAVEMTLAGLRRYFLDG
jgi:MarC family membrane protein